MIKPVVIVADDASKAELESDLHVWDESTFRANASALGGDINAILVTSQSQKIGFSDFLRYGQVWYQTFL